MRELFERVIDVDPHRRQTVLLEACGGNEKLLRQVELLIEAAEREDGFLLPPEPGRGHDGRIGRFTLAGELGAGNLGQVFLARDAKTGDAVALRIVELDPHDVGTLVRLRQEARLLERFADPAVARVHELGLCHAPSGPERCAAYLATEYVREGLQLVEWARRQKLDERERIDAFLAICSAVDRGHRLGVYHGNLSANNVLVGEDGSARVVDYGVARTFHAVPTKPEAAIGLDVTSLTLLLGALLDGHAGRFERAYESVAAMSDDLAGRRRG